MASNQSNSGTGKYQDQLMTFCQRSNLQQPIFQIMSDRRGGRTAWSATVNVQGQTMSARFWYDGQYVNNAKEDAAQVALERYRQIPRAGVQPNNGHGHQSPSSQQRPYYGVIGS